MVLQIILSWHTIFRQAQLMSMQAQTNSTVSFNSSPYEVADVRSILEINWASSIPHNTHFSTTDLHFFIQYTQLNLKHLIREKENYLLCWQIHQCTQLRSCAKLNAVAYTFSLIYKHNLYCQHPPALTPTFNQTMAQQ